MVSALLSVSIEMVKEEVLYYVRLGKTYHQVPHIKTLIISKIWTFENLICNSVHIMNSIVKYRTHPSNIVENVCHSKQFLKVMKPLLSNKIVPNEKITLVETTEIRKSNKEIAKVLNDFFSNIIKNLKIRESDMWFHTSASNELSC